MVRARCVFLRITDIIETVAAIKRFAEDEADLFRVLEVQSRFGLKVPISDVTLKIAINEEIVAELQLTLQSNAAAYHYAHVVYELQRSKIFSKTKMVDNKFCEFSQEISQLTNGGLRLKKPKEQGKEEALIPEVNHAVIRDKMGVASVTPAPETHISETLQKLLMSRKAEERDVREELGELMVGVTLLQGKWTPKVYKYVEETFNQQKGGLTLIGKTVLISQLFEAIDIVH